jgi:hypothetical protein
MKYRNTAPPRTLVAPAVLPGETDLPCAGRSLMALVTPLAGLVRRVARWPAGYRLSLQTPESAITNCSIFDTSTAGMGH